MNDLPSTTESTHEYKTLKRGVAIPNAPVAVRMDVLTSAVNLRLGTRFKFWQLARVRSGAKPNPALKEIISQEEDRLIREFAHRISSEFNNPQNLVNSGDRANAGF